MTNHPLWDLMVSFWKIGLLSLGGGNSMLKLLEDVCVRQHAWVTPTEFTALVGSTYLFPGLTVLKVAGLIGLKVGGILGLIVCVAGITLPGVVLAAVFYSMLLNYRDNEYVKKLILLMQYGAIALLAAALFSLCKPLTKDFSLQAGILACALFIVVGVFEYSPFVGLVSFIAIGMLVL